MTLLCNESTFYIKLSKVWIIAVPGVLFLRFLYFFLRGRFFFPFVALKWKNYGLNAYQKQSKSGTEWVMLRVDENACFFKNGI